jgi:hypothetical protein
VSILEFRDGDWVHCRNLDAVPNITALNIPQSPYMTTKIRSEEPDTLTASISWKRTSGQDLLILNIRMVDTTLLGRAREFLSSFQAQPTATGALLYYAAYMSIATIDGFYTKFSTVSWANPLLKLIIMTQVVRSYCSIQVGAPSVWNVVTFALCFPRIVLPNLCAFVSTSCCCPSLYDNYMADIAGFFWTRRKI